jgi:hypothetical protein
MILNSISISCYACALSSYWAGLYEGVDKEALEEGVTIMLRIAIDMLNNRSWKEDCQQIQDTNDNHPN